eukprot:398207_1
MLSTVTRFYWFNLGFNRSNCYSLCATKYRLFCTTEEWKQIPGFPNYHASTLGNIKNVKFNRMLFINYDRFRTLGKRPQIRLSINGGSKLKLVGRTILSTFHPIDDDKLQTNHIDGDPYNNKLCNLEWTTPKENMQHAFKIGIGNSHKTSVILRNMNSKSQHTFESIVECHRYIEQNISMKCCYWTIAKYCQLKSIQNGYQFRYADDKMYLLKVEDMVNEKWKICHVGHYKQQYFVSNMGRVKICYGSGKEKLKQPSWHNSGYFRVALDKSKLVHRVVAEHFVSNPSKYPFVEHIDGNPLNNCASNLRWV